MSNPVRLLLRVPVPWVFVLSYLIGAGLERLHPSNAKLLPGIGIAGYVLFLVAIIIAGWAWTIFRTQHTTTTPGETSARLVTWGPYRFSRNPMYVGLILAYLGEAGILRQAWPVLILPLTIAYVNFVVIPLEEQRLGEVFPEDYAKYRMMVRRWL